VDSIILTNIHTIKSIKQMTLLTPVISYRMSNRTERNRIDFLSKKFADMVHDIWPHSIHANSMRTLSKF